MECSVSEIRRALVAFGLLAGLVSAVLMFASPPVAAGPANLTVYGYVYDNGAQPLEGAGVVVEVLAGTFPSESATTDVDGFYMVEFDLADWEIGDTVRTTVIYGSYQEFEEAPAEADTVMQIDVTADAVGLSVHAPFQTMTVQDRGGTRRTVQEAVARIREMLPTADRFRREPVAASHLILGLECGGSDSLSGITANPALGAAADLVVGQGGTAVLGETPEIYGAEHLLTRRAVSREVAEKLIGCIRWWEDYTSKLGGEMDNNPTPGNKAGGLTTILEKSLGAVAKGGTTHLVEVYRYAAPVTARGLVFMDTPGYDPVSLTGMVAGGANLICFTTGRGSVYGCRPVPSIKLATNTPMYARMEEDMDINCGLIAEGEASVAELGCVIFRRMLEVASGSRTKSEALGIGNDEFVPWQIGAVM